MDGGNSSSNAWRSLKIAIVFNYEAFRFEAWLSAANRQVQRKYWELFRNSQWADYRVVKPATGVDSILECDLASDPDFGDPGSGSWTATARATAS